MAQAVGVLLLGAAVKLTKITKHCSLIHQWMNPIFFDDLYWYAIVVCETVNLIVVLQT